MSELTPEDIDQIKALHDKTFSWILDEVSDGETVSASEMALAALALKSCAAAMGRAALETGGDQ